MTVRLTFGRGLRVLSPAFRRAAACCTAVMAAVALLLAGADAAADEAAPAAPAGLVRILVIDMERVRNESAVGRKILADVSTFRQRAQQRYEAAQARFRAEDQALADVAELEREQRVAALRLELEAFKRAQAEDSARINQFVSGARELINARVKVILEAMMAERSAALVLHRHSVVATPSAFDVTRDVIDRLDADPPAISIEDDS